jgi:hypothetical protein
VSWWEITRSGSDTEGKGTLKNRTAPVQLTGHTWLLPSLRSLLAPCRNLQRWLELKSSPREQISYGAITPYGQVTGLPGPQFLSLQIGKRVAPTENCESSKVENPCKEPAWVSRTERHHDRWPRASSSSSAAFPVP